MNILDFWDFKSENDLTPEELKKYALEYYTEDFISNYSKWKNNITEINELMRLQLESKNIDLNYWEDMSFDYFCKHMLQYIEEWITENNDIEPKNITSISERLLNTYIYTQLQSMDEKKYSLPKLLASIVKPIIS